MFMYLKNEPLSVRSHGRLLSGQKAVTQIITILYISLLSIVLLTGTPVYAEDWHVDKNAANLVKFHSETTLLDFEGETDNIDGYAFWEDEKEFDEGDVYFEVQLAAFTTGIGKRDRDMREDVLETDKFPFASFSGHFNTVSRKGNTYEVASNGEISIHGHKKKMQIHATVVIENNKMNLKSNFKILLKDFDIDAPELLAFIKVAQEIDLMLDFNMVKVL